MPRTQQNARRRGVLHGNLRVVFDVELGLLLHVHVTQQWEIHVYFLVTVSHDGTLSWPRAGKQVAGRVVVIGPRRPALRQGHSQGSANSYRAQWLMEFQKQEGGKKSAGVHEYYLEGEVG